MEYFATIVNGLQSSIFFDVSEVEATIRGFLWKKVFLEISQNSQENTCVRISFLIKLQTTLAEVFSLISTNAIKMQFSLPLVFLLSLLSFLSKTENTKNLFTYFVSEICPRKERPKNI